MTRTINLSNYFLTIMCTIRNFTTLSPLFASVTARLTIMTFTGLPVGLKEKEHEKETHF